ncbi:MAG: hypothetical protein EXR62_16265 [Chloroflexi bacterium]|nr:hypothetical protein [Chloroflexota bacterium]
MSPRLFRALLLFSAVCLLLRAGWIAGVGPALLNSPIALFSSQPSADTTPSVRGAPAAPASAAVALTYIITDITPTAGESVAQGINDRGQVVGVTFGGGSVASPFLWAHGVIMPIIVAGAYSANVYAINNASQVAGGYAPIHGGGHAFRWTEGGGVQDLGCCLGLAINASGQIAGGSLQPGTDSEPGAALWTGAARSDLPCYSQLNICIGYGINDAGWVAGASDRYTDDSHTDGETRPVLWQNGAIVDLGVLGGRQFGSLSGAYDVNNLGMAVGSSPYADNAGATHAVVWQNGGIIDLGPAGEILSVAYAITEAGADGSGQIVGFENDGSRSYADRWTKDAGGSWQRRHLDELLPPGSGWELDVAYGINNLGQIVGYGRHNGVGHAFLLSPPSMEVTQAIQDLDNSVPLVAGKRTFALVPAPASGGAATARLYGFRDGASLGAPLLPLNPGGTVNAVAVPDRANLNDRFTFELPKAWTQSGAIRLRADISTGGTGGDMLNAASGELTFETVPPLKLRIVNMQYALPPATTVSARPLDMNYLESWLRRAYPISQLKATRRSYFDPILSAPPNGAAFNLRLQYLRTMVEKGYPNTVYYGMFSDQGGFAIGDTPNIPGWQSVGPAGVPFSSFSWDTDASYADWYGGHEIGHALGRKHAMFCGAADGAPYPYPNGAISGPAGDTQRFYGFDAGDAGLGLPLRALPSTWTDVMTYCANMWISDFTYRGLRDYIRGTFPAAPAGGAARAAPATISESGDYLAVFGTISTGPTATLSILSRQAQMNAIPPLLPGPYHIRLFDASNAPLADYAFTPLPGSEATTPVTGTGLIAQVVDFVPGTRRIAIYSNAAGHEIASAPVSANAPTVTITGRSGGPSLGTGGPVTVTWSGADADSDPLSYSLLYSFDSGATWRALAGGVTSTIFTVDAAELEGTGGAATGSFRVVANDGVLTGFADSSAFAVADKPPVARIANPATGSGSGAGQMVTLEGYGEDFEDGTLLDDGAVAPSALGWTSDRDGPLGSGSLVQLATLSLGTHLITLTVTDTAGLTGTVTISLAVAPLVQPGPTLSAGQSSMLFLGSAGAANPPTQTLGIRNPGSGVVNWTAASDASWLTITATQGTAPSDLSVVANTGSFLAGTLHIAHITLTAPGAAASPQTVHVVAQMLAPTKPGDFTGDGRVTIGDLQALAAQLGAVNPVYDLDSSSFVDAPDLRAEAAMWHSP